MTVVRALRVRNNPLYCCYSLSLSELLEVMIRAHDGGLTVDAIKRIDWLVHLGDHVAAEGELQRKQPHGFLFALHAVAVEQSWSEAHPGVNFDHKLERSAGGDDAAAAVKGSLELAPASQAAAAHKYTNIVTLQGFNACKYYFSGAGGVNCLRGTACHFWHGEPQDFAANKREWLAKRLEQRRAASHIDGDDADPHTKLMKAQRGRMFCDWLVETVGAARLAAGSGVVDVAGGKGDIPIQLWYLRGIPTTLIDPVRSRMHASRSLRHEHCDSHSRWCDL